MNKACFRDSAPCSGSKKGKTLQADKSLTGFYSTVLSARYGFIRWIARYPTFEQPGADPQGIISKRE